MEKLVTKDFCNIDITVDFIEYTNCVDIEIRYPSYFQDDNGQYFELNDSKRVFEVTQEQAEEYFKKPQTIFTKLVKKEITNYVNAYNLSLEEDEVDEYWTSIKDGDLFQNLKASFSNLVTVDEYNKTK